MTKRVSKEKKKKSPRYSKAPREPLQESSSSQQQQQQQQTIVIDRDYMKDLICMTKSTYHIKTAAVFGFMSMLLYLVMDKGNKKTVCPIIILFLLTTGLNIIFAITHPSAMTEISLTLLVVVGWFITIYFYDKK